jgi:hypothetical protein
LGVGKGVLQLEQGLRPKGVSDLGTVNSDFGYPFGDLIQNILVGTLLFPGYGHGRFSSFFL